MKEMAKKLDCYLINMSWMMIEGYMFFRNWRKKIYQQDRMITNLFFAEALKYVFEL